MKNAYMIMAHHNFGQLALLLSLLDDENNDLFVHVDSKAGVIDEAAITRNVKCSKVEFLPRASIAWGGVSQLRCELALLERATRTPHDYYHLLSGDDLPIKSNSQIAAFLEENAGREFVGIQILGKPEEVPSNVRERLSLYHPLQDKLPRGKKVHPTVIAERAILMAQRAVRFDRLRGKDVLLGKGSQWFSVTEDLARYMLDYEKHSLGFFDSYLCGDEMFPQTVIANSPFMDNIWRGPQQDDNSATLRLVDWDRAVGTSPHTFEIGDLEMIKHSQMLFARKFDCGKDAEIIEAVAALVRVAGD